MKRKSIKEIEAKIAECHKRCMSDDPNINGHGKYFYWYYALKWVLGK